MKNFSIVLPDSGISAEINLDNSQKIDFISGIIKSKILNSNLKFNFNYDGKKIEIYNSFFRSKKLSLIIKV